MELAGVLGVGAVTVFVCKQTANDYLHDRLPFRFLRKIAVVAGDDCDRLVWRYWVMKPELLNRVFAQQILLAPWGVTIPLCHVSPLTMVAERREVKVSTRGRLRPIRKSNVHTFALRCLAFANLDQHQGGVPRGFTCLRNLHE